MSAIQDQNIQKEYGYMVDLKIHTDTGTIDIPIHNIGSVRLIHSLSVYCTVARISIFIDPQKFPKSKLDGKETYELTVGKYPTSHGIADSQTYKFLSIDSVCHLPNQSGRAGVGETDRQPGMQVIDLHLADYNAIKLIHFNVNQVFENQSLQKMVQSLTSYASSGTKYSLVISTFDNREQMENILIPMQSFASALRYLNKYYGFYNSTSFMFIDQNNINITCPAYVKSLKTPIKIIQIGSNENIKTEPGIYYTNSTLSFKSNSNSTIAATGTTIKNLLFPDDSLFETKTLNIEDVAKDTKQLGKNQNFRWQDGALKSTNIIPTFHKSESHAKQQLSYELVKNVSSNIAIGYIPDMRLKDFLPLQSVIVSASNLEYLEFAGDYFIHTAIMEFTKKANAWIPVTNLNICRTGVGI